MEIDEVLDEALLDAHPLFAGLDQDARARILGLGQQVEYAEGQQIISEGDVGEQAYILLVGRVGVSQNGRQAQELGAGTVFGELSLIDSGPRTATITALVPVTCLQIEHDTFWELLRSDPALMEQMMRGFVTRLRDRERPLDPVTGLPNRSMFEELLLMSLGRSERESTGVAVVHVALDDFHVIHDALGTHESDRIIREIADRLGGALEGTVARAGDSEFLVLVPDIPLDVGSEDEDAGFMAAEMAAHAIEEAMRAPFSSGTGDGDDVILTASVGAAVYPRYSEDATTLMRDATAAVRQSKEQGPGGHLVSTLGTGDPAERLQTVTDLRRAVDAKSWRLLYQPVVDLISGKMFGVEALVRWDRDGELVLPGTFLPLAEDLGLIDAIGGWVMEESCRQWKAWHDEGLDLRLSFNLSPRELRNDDLVERLAILLKEYEVPEDNMVVEVTEMSMEAQPALVRGVLGKLAIAGMGISIDDFGTGYSSLSRLKDMPVSTLKVDRSFVSELPGRDEAVSVVRAVIGLANSLNMESLAEGIETPEQRSMLSVLGCKYGQGYLFAKPLTAERVLEVHAAGGKPYGEE